MRQPTLTEVLLVLLDRYQKDRKAQDAYEDKTATTLAQVTLDAFMKNVATELHERFGISLEGLAP